MALTSNVNVRNSFGRGAVRAGPRTKDSALTSRHISSAADAAYKFVPENKTAAVNTAKTDLNIDFPWYRAPSRQRELQSDYEDKTPANDLLKKDIATATLSN
jgi:D-serine dehydratase